MNQLRRYLGIFWMALGPIAMYYLLKTAVFEIKVKANTDTIIQWAVFAIIFLPIAIGMIIFGYYSFRGEYDREKN